MQKQEYTQQSNHSIVLQDTDEGVSMISNAKGQVDQ